MSHRPNAGPHERTAADLAENGLMGVKFNMNELAALMNNEKFDFMRQHGIDADRDGPLMDGPTLEQMVKNPKEFENFIAKLKDYENAVAAIHAIGRSGCDAYLDDRMFRKYVESNDQMPSVIRESDAIRKGVEAKRAERGSYGMQHGRNETTIKPTP
ncbi:MAG: hypothetical protein KGI97_04590 [Alphaproteobacteria bacterium]|nr:hypothetical protein [Alphaproteobacteria bacterium]